MDTLQVRQHTLHLPAFFPDATFGYRAQLTSADLSEAGVQ
jgi:queuine/archaeosine tRNA-ribosyltransferase